MNMATLKINAVKTLLSARDVVNPTNPKTVPHFIQNVLTAIYNMNQLLERAKNFLIFAPLSINIFYPQQGLDNFPNNYQFF